jgi:hypothetical protein
MATGKRRGMPGRRPAVRQAETGARCSACRKRKDKVHRNRKTGRLVCATCADRARMRVAPCTDCGERKLLQARSRCYACYKRLWRSARGGRALARPARRVRHHAPTL